MSSNLHQHHHSHHYPVDFESCGGSMRAAMSEFLARLAAAFRGYEMTLTEGNGQCGPDRQDRPDGQDMLVLKTEACLPGGVFETVNGSFHIRGACPDYKPKARAHVSKDVKQATKPVAIKDYSPWLEIDA